MSDEEKDLFEQKIYEVWLRTREQKVDCVREESSYASKVEKQQGEYTLEDYYHLPEDVYAELIDGVLYYHSSPKFIHQSLSISIVFAIESFIRKRKGECKVLYAPLDVNLDCDDKTMLQPDIFILCDRDKIKTWGIYGQPDFCMEIISESSRRLDCIKKLQKYVDAGVKEYWILDPYRKVMMTYWWEDDYLPHVYPLSGKLGLKLYQEELTIDLDELAEMIETTP
ncbi:MAG: Uma2 family endonuclease [Lachnospiraceae bacterium]|nr:Uma2 family endonuclease [Lachnospiraceae bacterium]